jgi:hypothetical protein
LSFVELVKKYAKFVPMALATVAAALVGAFHPGMTSADWSHVVVLAAGALSIGIAPNVPGYKYVKETLAAITAVATILVSGFTGFDANSVIQIIVAVGAAFGVASVKNVGDYLHLALNAYSMTNHPAAAAPVAAPDFSDNAQAPEGPADLPVAPEVAPEQAPAPVVVTPAETPAPPAEVSTTSNEVPPSGGASA